MTPFVAYFLPPGTESSPGSDCTLDYHVPLPRPFYIQGSKVFSKKVIRTGKVVSNKNIKTTALINYEGQVRKHVEKNSTQNKNKTYKVSRHKLKKCSELE